MTDAELEGAQDGACWFVGASWGPEDDQAPRFLEQGIWENGYEDKYLDLVKSIEVGDRIAIKATYTRKHEVPFDNRGQSVSVMAIKAIGTVKENLGDGRKVQVDWRRVDPPREWYFYTHRHTVWRVVPGDWRTDALIGFTFEESAQDIDRFRNAPYWRGRFGDTDVDRSLFKWTRFYEAVADKLLAFRDRRDELISGIHAIASRVDGLSYLNDQFADGSSGPLQDICPFTTMGIFNRKTTHANRRAIASELAGLLGVVEPVPESFEGIPILMNMASLFFHYDKDRQPDDIDILWEAFAQAIAYAGNDDAEARSAFVSAYDDAMQCKGVKWNLTMGLYWLRPWNFPTLDGQSQPYIGENLGIEIGKNNPKGCSNANDYLALLDTLEAQFQDDAYPVHSFPELSLAAYEGVGDDAGSDSADAVTPNDNAETDSEAKITVAPIKLYSIDDIVTDGCFVSRTRLEEILKRLKAKKNLILQGPPGTGKTWLAKRLAFALMKQRDESKVRAVQFHPNLSYEDFVRGWRPVGDGKLTLVDGPLVEMRNAAAADPASEYVLVIEEINRGSPAQILGEMLTLLEVDKRTQSEALELSYKRFDSESIFLPLNLYVIGTMNVADRSLALVDLALRRRFAFIDLEPMLGQRWQNWVQANCGIDSDLLVEIGKRLNALNSEISTDTALGPQFRIGHSYVTPPVGDPIVDARDWFRQVVETEIGPLLDEYWFDALAKSRKAKEDLLAGL